MYTCGMPNANQAPITSIAGSEEKQTSDENLVSPETVRREIASLLTECLDEGLKFPAIKKELAAERNKMGFMGELLRQPANPFSGLYMERVTGDPEVNRRYGIPTVAEFPNNTYVLTKNVAGLLGEDPRATLEELCADGAVSLEGIIAKSVNPKVNGDKGLVAIQLGRAPVYLTVPVEVKYRYDPVTQKGVFENVLSYSRTIAVVSTSVSGEDGSTVSYGENLVANAVKRAESQ